MSATRRTFGATWWGRAWIDALEHRARLDPNRLPRGRTYARQDRAGQITIEDSEVRALVRGSRSTPYRVSIAVRPLDDREWDTLLSAIASRAVHLAALLDGELDPGILDDAGRAGVDLLPGPGDLRPRCSCPDWADPCKHSAAVCYLLADEIDDDPFVVFALRGRTRDEVVADLRRRRAAAGGAAAGGSPADERAAVDRGVVARERWHLAELGELPSLPRPPSAPGRPAPWASDPPADAPFTAAGLRSLAEDAVERAWRLLVGEAPSQLGLARDHDLYRRAAALSARARELDDAAMDDWYEREYGYGSRLPDDRGPTDWTESPDWQLIELSRRARLRQSRLERMATAWHYGEADGLAVIDEPPWTPPPAVMAAARDTLAAERRHAKGYPRVDRNRITVSRYTQVRLDRRGRWWPFTKDGSTWELAGRPADAVDDLDLDLDSRWR